MNKIFIALLILIILVGFYFYKKTFTPSQSSSIPSDSHIIKKISGTDINGIYGLGLIVDTNDESKLELIKRTVEMWNERISVESPESDKYFFKDSDNTLLEIKSFILITENTAKSIKDYFLNPTLKNGRILWYASTNSLDLLSDRLINWMAENEVAKVWLVHNYESSIPDNMEDQFLELGFE